MTMQQGMHAAIASSTAEAERRAAPRKLFVADASVIESGSGACVRGRTGDLGTDGCYMDTLNPFEVGTQLHIRLRQDDQALETNGMVAFRLVGLGMGIRFAELSAEQKQTVSSWLSAMPQHDSLEAPASDASVAQQAVTRVEFANNNPFPQMAELIAVLTRKGILSQEEAKALRS